MIVVIFHNKRHCRGITTTMKIVVTVVVFMSKRQEEIIVPQQQEIVVQDDKEQQNDEVSLCEEHNKVLLCKEHDKDKDNKRKLLCHVMLCQRLLSTTKSWLHDKVVASQQ